jgi:hypothetical protein
MTLYIHIVWVNPDPADAAVAEFADTNISTVVIPLLPAQC